MQSEARRRAQAKYAATPRAKAFARAKYLRNREKIRARNRTPERKAARRAAWLKWYAARGLEARRAYQRSPAGKAVHRRHFFKKYYGITELDYAQLLRAQKGGCAICGGVNKKGRPLFVDYNHATKKVRALLCLWCNAMIGHCREDATILERAIIYLRKHLTTL